MGLLCNWWDEILLLLVSYYLFESRLVCNHCDTKPLKINSHHDFVSPTASWGTVGLMNHRDLVVKQETSTLGLLVAIMSLSARYNQCSIGMHASRDKEEKLVCWLICMYIVFILPISFSRPVILHLSTWNSWSLGSNVDLLTFPNHPHLLIHLSLISPSVYKTSRPAISSMICTQFQLSLPVFLLSASLGLLACLDCVLLPDCKPVNSNNDLVVPFLWIEATVMEDIWTFSARGSL